MNVQEERELHFKIGITLGNIAAVQAYDNWSDEFCRKEVVKKLGSLQKWIKEEYDLTSFTREQLLNLGFGTADKLSLVPLHLLPTLKDGTVLTSINGGKAEVGKDHIDNDIRWGCTAYGWEAND